MTFLKKLEAAIAKNNSLLCIGLDTDLKKIPPHILSETNPVGIFNKNIIDATAEHVCAYKLNSAYYEAMGERGMIHLLKTIEYIHTTYPEIPVICDAKRGDVGSTSEQYAVSLFDYLKADAVTVSPYLGKDSLLPFLMKQDKGIIVLCRTSNKSASDFQDLVVGSEPLYMHVAKHVVSWNKEYDNCLLVVGATWPEEMKKLRIIAPDMFFLVPGVGVQGGDLKDTLTAGLRTDKSGLLIHSARGIIYASDTEDFADAAADEAKKLRDKINTYR